MARRSPRMLENINRGVAPTTQAQPVDNQVQPRKKASVVFEDLPDVPDPVLEPRKEVIHEEVQQQAEEPVNYVQPAYEPPVQSSVSNTTTYERLPSGHKARYVQRHDVPTENYTERIRTTSFNIYDKELRKWLKDFSENNQDNGGCPIPQAFILEMVLGILHYDLKMEPNGYRTRDEFIADLKRKMGIQ